jgi:aspartokinase/homoserine dehydrogenase 1
LSFGEQLSAYIIAEAVKNRGALCQFVDARTLIKTDNNFGGAAVDIKESNKLILNYFKIPTKISVMGGFIASTKKRVTTTLGRGGSDYTAALVGGVLRARAIEIWTDVDALMTADPRKVKNALPIAQISYEEAEKMASLGAKVIHPKTMKPARLKGIPIYIKNTFNPKAAGTRISSMKVKNSYGKNK